MSQEWHALKTDELMDTLRTSRRGLSGEEARRRLEEYGPNELAERGKVSALRIFLVQFKDIFVIMLLAAIVFSVIVGYYESQTTPGPHGLIEDYADAIAIGAIVVLNAVVGFIQEYRSERAMEAMRKLTAPKASLMRDGGEVVVPARGGSWRRRTFGVGGPYSGGWAARGDRESEDG